MIATKEGRSISLRVRDVSRQRLVNARNVPQDATVGEVVKELVSTMGLPREDVEGRQLTFHARLEREGRHLQSSEVVGDALQDDDEVVLQPKIQAGAA